MKKEDKKMELVDVYNQNYEKIGVASKKLAHKSGLWHKSVVLILLDYNTNEIVFSLKQPGLYGDYSRPDYLDFATAGHVQHKEEIYDVILREINEELGIKINDKRAISFVGSRQTSHMISHNFIENEFQFFFVNKSNILNNFKTTDEIRALVKIDILELIKLFNGDKKIIIGKLISEHGNENMKINIDHFVHSYINKDQILIKIAKLAKNILYGDEDVELYL